MSTDDAFKALVANIEADLQSKVRASVRAELEADISLDRIQLGKRLITKRTVWLKLGISEDGLDVLRRINPLFPQPKKVLGRLQWREQEVDRFIDAP